MLQFLSTPSRYALCADAKHKALTVIAGSTKAFSRGNVHAINVAVRAPVYVGVNNISSLDYVLPVGLHYPGTSPSPLPSSPLRSSSVLSSPVRSSPPIPSSLLSSPALSSPLRANESTKAAEEPATPAVDRAVERRLIAQLLSHFKQTAEVRQYMKYYGSVDSDRFAIVRISGDLLHNHAELQRVASSLAFLHRIGLVPVVVHGAGLFTGRRSNAVASAARPLRGESAEDTRKRLMSAARGYMLEANATLVEALRAEGVKAVSLTGSIFKATRDSEAEGSLAGVTGCIQGVDVSSISEVVEAGHIPIVASVGGDGMENLTFSTQDATLALARVVKPLKIIWLRPEGGLRSADGSTVRAVDISRDSPALVDEDEVSCFQQLSELYSKGIAGGEPGSSVSITKPENLAAELFTNKGAGTILLRGERVLSYNSIDDIDLDRVVALIQEAFGAALPADYFTKFNDASSGRKLRRILVSESYRAVAIVTEEEGFPGVAYLDKFAVSPSAQGDKLGEILWRQMVEEEPHLYWRSRSSNRVNPWYYEQSTGCFKNKGGDWTVFWRGLEDDNVMKAINTALALPPTFPVKVYPKPAPAAASAAQQPVLK